MSSHYQGVVRKKKNKNNVQPSENTRGKKEVVSARHFLAQKNKRCTLDGGQDASKFPPRLNVGNAQKVECGPILYSFFFFFWLLDQGWPANITCRTWPSSAVKELDLVSPWTVTGLILWKTHRGCPRFLGQRTPG